MCNCIFIMHNVLFCTYCLCILHSGAIPFICTRFPSFSKLALFHTKSLIFLAIYFPNCLILHIAQPPFIVDQRTVYGSNIFPGSFGTISGLAANAHPWFTWCFN